MRRGDIRTAILAVLAERPGHGYDIMSRLQEKSGGMWRPSAGSVYPTLQQLEDEGLVTSADADGKRVYTVTADGIAEAERRIEEAGGEPWASDGGAGVHPGHLFRSIGMLTMAAKQIVAAGTPAQLAAAVKVTDHARKELYRILGDDDLPLDENENEDEDEDEDTPPVEA
jgi:DNA-binding PadR family transcriptional regulator